MASTFAGDRLTDAHRLAQVSLASQAVAAARLLWSRLNPNDLAASRYEWLALMLTLVGAFDVRSARLAAAYLETFRDAEGFAGGPLVGVDGFNREQVVNSLGFLGPGRIIMAINSGVEPVVAHQQAFTRVGSGVVRHTLEGGRRVIDQSALANPRSVGWRRVADADPCEFCAMLAGRGAKYKSESSAGKGRKWHDGCGCTVEEVFAA